jgi:hypothetical protein
LKFVLLAHVAATLFMTGVIWFVQVVHYPLFARVLGAEFNLYAAAHGRLTTYIVAPPMLVELVTGALLLFWRRPAGIGLLPLGIGFALIIAIWLSTFLLQVPQHDTLGVRFDEAAHRTLVFTNWLRTWAWSLRSLLVLWLIAALIKE